jgi:uncharacterized protein (DUF2336 family)
MNRKTADESEIFSGSIASNVTELRYSEADTSYFLDKERYELYVTLSGLLDAGVPLKKSLKLLNTEFIAQKKERHADQITAFFEGVARSRDEHRNAAEDEIVAETIGELAEKCFGKRFISREEMTLLRGLAHTDNASTILRAAADILKFSLTIARSPRERTPSRQQLLV